MSEMFCPLLAGDCKKSGCAWWLVDDESCAVRLIGELSGLMAAEEEEEEESGEFETEEEDDED